MGSKSILAVYVVASVATFVAKVVGSGELNSFTRPLLMPVLLFYLYRSTKGRATARILWLGLAIFLSWVSDLALVYEVEIFVMTGIGFFLLAPAAYLVVLSTSAFRPPSFDVLKALPFLIYAMGLLGLLIISADGFKIPVALYVLVISAMAGMARLRQGNTSETSYRLALYGSLFFLVSGSLLAVGTFYYPIPLSGAWALSTYCIAQFLLVDGLVRHVD